ncbi:MAG TPA: hypothetical protein VJ990_06275 [Clostridia bacterium]|nr:hypothetical protein [Clostridia bacterium]
MKKLFLLSILIIALSVSGCSREKDQTGEVEGESFASVSGGEFTFDQAGEYGPKQASRDFDGDLIVDADGVSLKNVDVSGDLTITSNVGDGDVYLQSVSVAGTLFVNGGGENSIKIKDGSFPVIRIDRPQGKVRIDADSDAVIVVIEIASAAEIDTKHVDKILVTSKDDSVQVDIHGSVKELAIASTAEISVEDQAEIDKMVIEASAKESKISGEGNISEAQIDAESVRVDTNMDDYYSTTYPKALYLNGIPEDWKGQNSENSSGDRVNEDQDNDIMTKENWEVGMPWDTEWGDEPEGAWSPDDGVPWDPAWGEPPNDQDVDHENEQENIISENADKQAPEEPGDEGEISKENWEVGMPWDSEWGDEPEGAWSPDDGVPWDPAWGSQPDWNENGPDTSDTTSGDEESPETEASNEENALRFIKCESHFSSNSIEMEIVLSKPATLYYVFEDLSTMMGNGYLPSEKQIMAGLNATGGPDGKTPPDMGEDMEFPQEALIKGTITITEANKSYKRTFESSNDENFQNLSSLHGSFLATDAEGNIEIRQ